MTSLNTDQQKLPDSICVATRRRSAVLSLGLMRFAASALVAGFVLLPGLSNALTCEEWFQGQAARITSNDVFRDYDASRTLSQQVRDNAPFYWAEAREQKMALQWPKMPDVLKTEVIGVGDLHSGNFSPISVPGKGVVYTLFDVKDLGYVPASFDINRLVLNTIAIAKRRRVVSAEEQGLIAEQIFASYRAGLLREDFQLTEQHELSLPSPQKFQRKLKKKMEKKQDVSGQLFVDGELYQPLEVGARQLNIPVESLRATLESTLRSRLGWGHLADAIVKVPYRGGSKENIRILVTFNLASGQTVMKELKRVSETATSIYHDQIPISEVHAAASQFLDYDILSVFPQVSIGSVQFTLRDKKLAPITVPYKQKDPTDFDELMSLAIDHAQWTGTFHGRQMAAQQPGLNKDFASAFRDHQPVIIERYGKFNRRHLRRLKEGIE